MKIPTRLLVLSGLMVFLVSCSVPTGVGGGGATQLPVGPQTPIAIPNVAAGSCPYGAHFVANPVCTPGAVDNRVTQADISSTICSPGYTALVRPPEAVTYPIKVERMKAYGVSGMRLSGFELDHSIPLELGGSSAIANLWPQPAVPVPGFHQKDLLENGLNKLVCDGKLDLATAQQVIAKNWYNAYQQYCVAQKNVCFAYSGNTD